MADEFRYIACSRRIFSSLLGGGDGVLEELGGIMIDGFGSLVSRAEFTLLLGGESDASRMRPCIAHFVLVSSLSNRVMCFFFEVIIFPISGVFDA